MNECVFCAQKTKKKSSVSSQEFKKTNEKELKQE